MIDDELRRALSAHAEAADLSLSATVRDLLRHAVGVVSSEREAGWIEGYNAGLAAVNKTVGQALGKLSREGEAGTEAA